MSGTPYTPEILQKAAALFVAEKPEEVSLLSSSERDDDLRAAALLTHAGQRSVLKLASNAFTTARRIEGWAELIGETRALGV